MSNLNTNTAEQNIQLAIDLAACWDGETAESIRFDDMMHTVGGVWLYEVTNGMGETRYATVIPELNHVSMRAPGTTKQQAISDFIL